MKKLISLAALAFAVCLSAAGPASATPCNIPVKQPRYGMKFFLDIHPTDGPLEAWCRLQRLTGEYRVNIAFMDTGAHRTREIAFDGQQSLPQEDFLYFLQSLLPIQDGPAKDPDGMPFPKVLERAVQGGASLTPNGVDLSMPDIWPGAKATFLWERMAIRVRPVKIGGGDFAVSVVFKPSRGRFVRQINGQETAFLFHGWRGRLDTGNAIIGKKCSDLVPYCAELPDVVPIYGSWVLDEIVLEAEGETLSNVAEYVLKALVSSNAGHQISSNIDRFDPVAGTAKVEIKTGPMLILGEAFRHKTKIGTGRILIRYKEREDIPGSFAKELDDVFIGYREYLLRAVGQMMRPVQDNNASKL